MQFSTLTLAAVLASLSAAQGTPDGPAVFYASMFRGADCTGSSSAFLYSMGTCVNRNIAGEGSAKIRFAEQGRTFVLTAWTDAGCTGTAIKTWSAVNACQNLEGQAAASWSYEEITA